MRMLLVGACLLTMEQVIGPVASLAVIALTVSVVDWEINR